MAARLMKELKSLKKEEEKAEAEQKGHLLDIRIAPINDNIHTWSGHILGPSDSPFEGGHFKIDIRIPSTYPMAPPAVRFITKIFHPNIHFKSGEVCLDILKKNWTPAWTLQSVCRAVIALLAHPEPDSPLNCDAGNLMRCGDRRGYHSLARMYTTVHALPQ